MYPASLASFLYCFISHKNKYLVNLQASLLGDLFLSCQRILLMLFCKRKDSLSIKNICLPQKILVETVAARLHSTSCQIPPIPHRHFCYCYALNYRNITLCARVCPGYSKSAHYLEKIIGIRVYILSYVTSVCSQVFNGPHETHFWF